MMAPTKNTTTAITTTKNDPIIESSSLINNEDHDHDQYDDDDITKMTIMYEVEKRSQEDEVSDVSNSLETEESKEERRRLRQEVCDCIDIASSVGMVAPKPSKVTQLQTRKPRARTNRVSFEQQEDRQEEEAAVTVEPPLPQPLPHTQRRKKQLSSSFGGGIKKVLPSFNIIKFWDFGSVSSRRRRHNAMLSAMSSTTASSTQRSSSLTATNQRPEAAGTRFAKASASIGSASSNMASRIS